MSPKAVTVKVLQTLLVVVVGAWSFNLPARLGWSLYAEQILLCALGLSLALVYLSAAGRGGDRSSPGLLSYLAAIIGLATCLTGAALYPDLVRELVYRPTSGIIIGSIVIVLALEAVRRVAGFALVVFVLVFLTYTLTSHLLPGDFAGRPVDLTRAIVYLGIDSNAALGIPLQVAVFVIIPFLFLGQTLLKSGGSEFFTDLSVALVGRFRGGAAKISVIASALFGSISGSAVANVASTGVITIPLMKKLGFPARTAAGVEAAASTGGQLLPPIMGAAAFLMAEFLEVPYATVMVAAIVPALLYYITLFIQADLAAAVLGLAAVPRKDIPTLRSTLGSGWHFPLPFVVFLIALLAFDMRPERAALLAAALVIVSGMLFGYRGRRVAMKDLWNCIPGTATVALDIVMVTAAAGMVIGLLNLSGLSFSLSFYLIALTGGSLALLMIAAALISIILGMGMPTSGVYVLLATLVAPALIEAGIEPLAAHLFVLYFGMLSMLTPPVAIAAFTAANIAGTGFWKTGWVSVRLAWSAYIIPFLFILSPPLLLAGTFTEIGWTVLTTIVGIALVSIAMSGFLFSRLHVAARGAYFVCGLLAMTPTGVHSGAFIGQLAGLAVAGVLVVLSRHRERLQRRTA